MFSGIQDFTKKIIKTIKKNYTWKSMFVICVIILLTIRLYNECKPKIENFTSFQKEKFISRKGNEVYDNFYCSIYDKLVHDPMKNNFETEEFKKITNMGKNSYVLDVGCGTGHHVNELKKSNIKCMGLDKSQSMVALSKANYPDHTYKRGDLLNSIIFHPRSFTHVTCLYFTIYCIEDKLAAFKNFYDWLKPGGYLVLHLVNRNEFDPILDAGNPLLMVSPQKYAKKRITNTIVKFDNFQYKSNFELDKPNNKAYFKEEFKSDKDNKVRKNEHIIFMETQKHILGLAKSIGFILKGKVDMVQCMYEYQYLYILYKPA
jgi:ubiquinone/menaquinone biosynthesis C-methylase UbiE